MPAAVMHPRLLHDDSDSALLKAVAYAHALAAVADLADQAGTGVTRTGALQIAAPNYPPERLEAVARTYAPAGFDVRLLTAREAAALAGSPSLAIPEPVLWFGDVCLVDTPQLTRTLLDHPGIELVTGEGIDRWPGEPTVLACGTDARRFEGAGYLELGRVHGQLDVFRSRSEALAALAVPIVGNGYVTPLPGRAPGTPAALIAAGATWTVSSDRNPVVGPLFDQASTARVDRYVSLGHGSMGTVTSHLAATVLAARIQGDFEPLAAACRVLVTPLRFRQRQARRGYRFGAVP